MSPNLEFATVFIGVMSVWFFDLTVWQAILAAAVGNLLGSISHGVLSARGPSLGVPQMIISRIPFGFTSNAFPAGLTAIVSGIGWFAVNTVSGSLALGSLTRLDPYIALVIVVVVQILVAFFGFNLVQHFEKIALPLLAGVFALAFIFALPHADVSAAKGGGGLGGFLIVVGASFGYAAGWNPNASDYTRYLPVGVNRRVTGLWAGLGIFVSCTLLQSGGAFVATYMSVDAASPTSEFTKVMPTFVASLVLVAIVLGCVSANAINLYSGSMSFLAMGISINIRMLRATITVIFGACGTILAWFALENINAFEDFLLLVAYWVGPWLGVMFMDQWLHRGRDMRKYLFNTNHQTWHGAIALLISIVASVWLFGNQTYYVGLVPARISSFGDITFEVGFLLSATIYYALFKLTNSREISINESQVSVSADQGNSF
jgi:purine-cytosine permease-like protein